MSRITGSAVNGSDDIQSLIINGVDTDGAAYGGERFFTKGSELYSVISTGRAYVGTPTQITLSCNRKTVYVVTYAITSGGSMTGLARDNVTYTDTLNGRRNISFTVSFGTAGQRTLRVYGATTSSSAANHRSVCYIDIPLYIYQAPSGLLMASAPRGNIIDPFDYTISDVVLYGSDQPDIDGLTAEALAEFAEKTADETEGANS